MAAIGPLVAADPLLVISSNVTWTAEDYDDHPRQQVVGFNVPSNDTNLPQQPSTSQNLEQLRQLLKGMFGDQEKNFDSTTQAGHKLSEFLLIVLSKRMKNKSRCENVAHQYNSSFKIFEEIHGSFIKKRHSKRTGLCIS